MPTLRQSHIQAFYRPVLIVFCSLAIIVIAGVVYASSGNTVIRVTPALSSLTTTFSVTVGPEAEGDLGLIGTVTTEDVSATVTAAPSVSGAEVPAHASGTVIIKNTSSAPQPLAAGTRLEHANGVIVRTTTRLDVPAKGQVTATAVADPLGEDGNVPPGRFTIVALRPANQALIFGESTASFSGGLVGQSGSLSLENLTAASNAGEEAVREKFGTGSAGVFKSLVPVSVATVPAAEEAASTYAVTVTMKGITITYDQQELDKLIRQRLASTLTDGQEIASIETPVLAIESQPTSTSATVVVTVEGLSQIRADASQLAASQFAGLSREAIIKKLLANEHVATATVDISPWWRSAAVDDPSKIHLDLLVP